MKRPNLLILLLIVLGLFGCNDGSTIQLALEIVEPLDDPPLNDAARLEFTVVDLSTGEEDAFFALNAEGNNGFSTLDLSLDGLPVYADFRIKAKALDADDKIIASGRSIEIVTALWQEETLALYLAPPAAATRPPLELAKPRAGLRLVGPNQNDVLVIGGADRSADGNDGDSVGSVGYFSPAMWTLAPLEISDTAIRLDDGMVGHTATVLDATTVVVIGGMSRVGERTEFIERPYLIGAALTDIVDNVTLSDGFTPRIHHAAAPALLLGEVWGCGGEDKNGALLTDCFTVDADTLTLSPAGDLQQARSGHTMTPVIDSDGAFAGALIVGGSDAADALAEWWAADADEPQLVTGAPTQTRRHHAAVLFKAGVVLVAGGEVDGVVSAGLLRIDTACAAGQGCPNVSAPAATLQTARAYHSLTVVEDGLALACGGVGADGEVLDSCEWLRLSDASIEQAGTLTLARPRAGHDAILLPDGNVLLAGGYNDSDGALDSVEVVTPPVE